jgi:CheY-like chemotaxis protein
MSLNYKILCIDDNPRTIKSKLNQVEQFLKEEGFRPEITLIENDQDIDKYLDDPLLDLIVTDYYIRDELNGKQLAENIRGSEKMVEIILYSQKEGTDLYKEVGALDGVYISNREGLEDKIKDVIKITIRRTQNVSNMRGIVISEAIDIENHVEEIIISYFADKGDIVRKALERSNFDFGKKVMILGSIAKKLRSNLNKDQKGFEKIADLVKSLCKDVVWTRNVLSHVKHKTDQNGQHILTSDIKSPDGTDTITINTEWYKETRKKLRMHSENLKAFADFIISGVVESNAS